MRKSVQSSTCLPFIFQPALTLTYFHFSFKIYLTYLTGPSTDIRTINLTTNSLMAQHIRLEPIKDKCVRNGVASLYCVLRFEVIGCSNNGMYFAQNIQVQATSTCLSVSILTLTLNKHQHIFVSKIQAHATHTYLSATILDKIVGKK